MTVELQLDSLGGRNMKWFKRLPAVGKQSSIGADVAIFGGEGLVLQKSGRC